MTETPTLLHEGRISLTRRLGEGGMAVVYEAYDHDLEVWRAAKFLRPELASKKGLRRRFLAEARALAKLDHPNIVRVYDVGEQDGWPFLLMSLVRGGSLEDYLEREGRMSPRLAARVISDVCAGVQAAHDVGIVHRDLKPDNVLVTTTGVVMVTDFGIAIVDERLRRTRTGSVMGTLGYMAPEQQRDAKHLGPAADVYALGATLFALVTGEQPTDLHMAATEDGMLEALPDPLRAIVRRATVYRPEERYPSARALASALQQVTSSLPDDRGEAPLTRRIGTTAPPPRSAPPVSDPGPVPQESANTRRTSNPGTDPHRQTGNSAMPSAGPSEQGDAKRPLPYIMPSRPIGATASDGYIDHDAEEKLQRKRAALEKLRQIERRKRATAPPPDEPEPPRAASHIANDAPTPLPPEPRHERDDRESPVPQGAAVGPSGADLADAAKEAADKTFDLLLQALKPMWPGLIAFGLLMTILVGLAGMGAWTVRGAARDAERAQSAFLEALVAEEALVDDLQAMGTRDDTVPILHMQMMATRERDKRIQRGIDLVLASRVTHEKHRFSTPAAMQHRAKSAEARLNRLQSQLQRMQLAATTWATEANQGLGALAVKLGLAPGPG